MFCYQCQETAKGEGCTVKGVCGKTAEVAALQDLLVQATKGIAMYAHRARQLGVADREVDLFVVEALFTTVTNVNFDPLRMRDMLMRAAEVKEQAKRFYLDVCGRADRQPEELSGPAAWTPAADLDGLIRQGEDATIEKRIGSRGPDIAGLEELLTYGLKGMAAYADHALILGQEDDEVFAFFHEALDFLSRDDTTLDELLAMNLKCGGVNLKALGLLDAANTGTYGHPEPTQVRVTPVKGKAILISGHDLKDLEELLKQSEGRGINVYTHSEMLPALAYPGLKKYKHLAGNYGGAWYEQKAVCILLTLLYLGIKNIRLGPSLPAFVTPNALNVLVEKFNIMPISAVEQDLAACLEK